MRVFVAGASGAVGQRLVPQLVTLGHHVTATTRTESKLPLLGDLGAEPVLVDGLDAAAVGTAVAHAEADAIVHQMTALTATVDLRHFDRTFAATNLLRTVGTDNLLAAARATAVQRVVVQSFTGWPNERVGSAVKTEHEPLDPTPPVQQRTTMTAIRHLEDAVLAAPLDGVALRYGLLYGPGTSDEMLDLVRKRRMPIVGNGSATWSMTHIDDAASAAVAALERGRGIYNIVDDDPALVSDLLTELATIVGARPPRHIPVWLARILAGEVVVSMFTRVRGSSNAKAKRELGWTPDWGSWRDGFRYGLTASPTRQR